MDIFTQLRESTTNFVSKRFWYIILAVILFLGFLIFRNAFVIVALIVLTILSKLLEVILPRSANIDLSLFTLVILQQAYGLPVAFTIAVVSYFVGTLIKGKFVHHVTGENLILPPLGYLITGLVISFFSFNIFTTGMIATAIYASMMTISYGILYRFPVFDMFIYLATIIPFNFLVFQNFGEPALNLLG